MDREKRMDLVMAPPTEEVLVEEELRNLLDTNDHPEHYIGFEISGLLHLGTLLMCGYKINDLAKAGFKVKVFLADWHSYINKKLGGNWDTIIKASKYFAEGFKLACPKAEIVLGSEIYHNNDEYWKDLVRFSSQFTLARNTRCLTIMGRTEKDSLNFSQYLYPPMQGVDVKYLGPDLSHGGMDQRKIHALAREVFPKLGWKKPAFLHHHLLMGLAEPPAIANGDKLERVMAAKMSKSKPWTAIFIHDSDEEIYEKLRRAWCPEKTVEMNPVLELVKYVLFHEKKEFLIEREKKHGGDIRFEAYSEVENIYAKGELHPKDLKNAVARDIAKIVKPLREHFEKPAMKYLRAIFEKVDVTR